MDKCKNCEWNEFKNSRDRPLYCCSCELSYHYNELTSSIIESILADLKFMIDQIVRILNKFI